MDDEITVNLRPTIHIKKPGLDDAFCGILVTKQGQALEGLLHRSFEKFVKYDAGKEGQRFCRTCLANIHQQ